MSTLTDMDLNELTEKLVDMVREELVELDGKMEQRHYNSLADTLFAFLTTFVKIK